MKRLAKSSWIVLIMLFLTACGGASASPTTAPAAFYTQAVETAFAQLTETAMVAPNTPTVTPSPQVTPTLDTTNASPITDTPGATTPQITPQLTPLASETPLVLPTKSGPTDVLCDNAKWIADIGIQDGDEVDAGSSFVKTWRVQNNGACTWTYDYLLIFGWGGDGTHWSSASPVKFGKLVVPGDFLEISVTLPAPTTAGNYFAAFRLKTTKSVIFGDPLTLSIKVK